MTKPFVIANCINFDNQLGRMCRWYGPEVVGLIYDGIMDATIDGIIGAQYLSDTKFESPTPPPKRKKRQKDLSELMIIDLEKLGPSILEKLKAVSSKEAAKLQQAAADAQHLLQLFATLKEVPRNELEPYIRAMKPEQADTSGATLLH